MFLGRGRRKQSLRSLGARKRTGSDNNFSWLAVDRKSEDAEIARDVMMHITRIENTNMGGLRS